MWRLVETECERLKVAGTQWPKDLPTKPKRPPKPKPVVEHDPGDNEEEESGEGGVFPHMCKVVVLAQNWLDVLHSILHFNSNY